MKNKKLRYFLISAAVGLSIIGASFNPTSEEAGCYGSYANSKGDIVDCDQGSIM